MSPLFESQVPAMTPAYPSRPAGSAGSTRSTRSTCPAPRLGAPLLALAAALAVLGASTVPAQAQNAPRPRIEKAADLPRFNYPVPGKLEDIVRQPERFAPLAAALRRDTESVLAGYDIPDKGTRRDLLTLLAVLDYLDGRHAEALKRAEEVRALQDKPADKLLSGLRLRAMATAAQQHAPGSAAHTQAVAEFIRRELAPMPFNVVANDIRQAKASAEVMGEALMLGRVREQLQPMADSAGALSNEFAPSLVYARFGITASLPLKAALIEVYTRYLADNKVDKPDIWAARDLALPAEGPYKPVTVAVWDSGVDTPLFKTQLARDGRGQPLVIAFDKHARPAQGELLPIPPELRSKLPQMIARTKGFSDLQSNIDSPEATEVKRLLSGLAPDQYKAVVEELGLSGNYEHGTHVAGIALAGNPHARLVTARIEFNHKLRPEPCPSAELARRDAANAQTTVDFFKRHGVRVVNMSWGGSIGDIENELEQCGTAKTPEARKALARTLFDITKQGLTKAFASAPGILFVAAAGNSNSDASFTESMPADIVLPNLLTVGAVDRAGDEAPFTSYGPTVKVHANGYQVESYLPGGMRVALSGTSMAAPQVTGLAAKLLAAHPKLTPVQLIQVIAGTAERSEDGRRFLMHPKRALEAAAAVR